MLLEILESIVEETFYEEIGKKEYHHYGKKLVIRKGAESNKLLKEKCSSKRNVSTFGPDSYFSDDVKMLRPMSDTEGIRSKDWRYTVPTIKKSTNSNCFIPTSKEIENALEAIIAFEEEKMQRKRKSVWGRVKKQLGVKESTRNLRNILEMLKSVERGIIPQEVQTRIILARWHHFQKMEEVIKKSVAGFKSVNNDRLERNTWLKMFFSFPSFS